MGRSVRIDVGGRQAAIAENRDRGEGRDAAHRATDEGNPGDAALAEPGQCARHVLDLVEAERRRGRLGIAVTAEVEPEHAGRPPQGRSIFDQIGGNRAGPAVEKEDRLVWVGPPRRLGGVAGAITFAGTVVGREPATREAQCVARPKPDDLPAEGIDGRAEARLLREHPRRVE